jgi:hypothetical protein
MIVKVHERKEGSIVSVVDKELIGKKFEEGELQLDLGSAFYQGEQKTSDEVGDLIRNAYGVNLVGERAIKLAIEEGIIDNSMVKRIANIPYYQGTTEVI